MPICYVMVAYCKYTSFHTRAPIHLSTSQVYEELPAHFMKSFLLCIYCTAH